MMMSSCLISLPNTCNSSGFEITIAIKIANTTRGNAISNSLLNLLRFFMPDTM